MNTTHNHSSTDCNCKSIDNNTNNTNTNNTDTTATATAESNTTTNTNSNTPAVNNINPQLSNANPIIHTDLSDDDCPDLLDPYLDELRSEIYSLIRNISDPEHPHTLEQLKVVQKKWITVNQINNINYITIEYHPTVPHCSLATLIGLCIRSIIIDSFPLNSIKLTINIVAGSHSTAAEIIKQLNDKERAAAAMENPTLRDSVIELIKPKYALE